MDTDQDVAVVENVPCEPEETSEETAELDLAILNQDSQTQALEEESNPDADSAALEDDVTGDHMECDDSENAPMYIDDDSSSRAYPETVSDMPVGSPSMPMPMPEAGGRRNKRKNFKPRNIVYTYTDSEDNEGTSDAETRAQHPSSEANYDPSSTDVPLDLSETPTMRRSLLPRRLDEAVDLTGSAAIGGGGSGNSPSAHPRLNALLSRSTSPGQQEEGSGGGAGGGTGTGGPGSGGGGGGGGGLGGGSSDGSDMKEYAELTMRRLLGLYGLNDLTENLALSPAAIYQGM